MACMKYDGYRFIEKEKMSSVINHDVLTLESVYRHFLEKDDECIYVTDREKLVGVVSVSDWQKAYAGGNVENCINTHFSYLKDIDFADAERLILRIKKIHEVPVIKNGKFIGVVVNGEHKSEKEWNGIRKDNRYIKYRIAEWEKEQLRELFNYVSPSVYVYFGFDEKNLKWTEHDFEMCDNKLKHKNWIAGLEEMSEEEQRDFFGEYYSEEYVREFINNLGEVSGSCKNGINMINDMHSKYINVVDGYRRIAEYKEQGERKIYFIGPCTFFGAYVSDNQTIEYYLYQLMKENNISGYEILNAGLLGPAITLSGKLLTESVSDDDIVIYWAVMDKNALKDMKDIYPNIKIGSDWTEAFNSIENPVGNILDGLAHCNYKINKRLADIIFNDIKPELEQKFDRGGGTTRAIA